MTTTRVFRSHPKIHDLAEILSYLNANEVAERIGCSRVTVLRRERTLPGFPQRRKNGYWAEFEVDRWIASSAIPRRAYRGVS